jgi:epoxyqueuosine reductase
LSLKEDIKKYADERLEMDYVGIANTERFSGAPEGTRPTDILPGAKSVIVMAARLSQGVVQTIFRAHEDGMRNLMCVYGSYGYSLFPNFYLKFAAFSMARFLEKRGHMSTPLPSGPGSAGAPFSNRHAAVAAGIGYFGWHGLVIAPDYGPRLRIVSVITRAELEPDPLIPIPKACDPVKCGICVKICPSHAISAKASKTCKIDNEEYTYTSLNLAACQIATEGLTEKTLALNNYPMPDHEITMGDLEEARSNMDPRQKHEVIGTSPAYHCGKCLAYCPIGSKGWQKTVSKLKTSEL